MKSQTQTKENKISNPKKLTGIVVSTKMKDTAVVNVSRYFKHKKYEKFISRQKKYKIHDVGNTCSVGDKVEIVETRPISKDKHFLLSKIILKAKTAEADDLNVKE